MEKQISEIMNPATDTIVDLFLQQVEKTPDEIAVVYKDQQLTYKELNILSNQLANYLINKHHIVFGNLVGLLLEKSEIVIVCIIGLMKLNLQ